MPSFLPEWLPEWIEKFSGSTYGAWAQSSLSVLAIVAGTLSIWALVRRAAHSARRRFLSLNANQEDGDPRASIAIAQRLTALQLLVNSVRYALFAAAVLLIFSQLNLLKSDSLLFPAGFLGAALGLGAQNLVRDVVAGFFIVFEGQFAVGDYVKINGVIGRIEEVGLRVTSLRDESSQIHFFPNGAITTVARAPRRAADLWLWVPVAPEANRDEVVAATQRALDDFDAVFDAWQEPPQVLEDEINEGERVRFALRVQPARAVLVREKLLARVTGALEAAGMKNEAGATVELTAAPAS